jgi:hypothetical protein
VTFHVGVSAARAPSIRGAQVCARRSSGEEQLHDLRRVEKTQNLSPGIGGGPA